MRRIAVLLSNRATYARHSIFLEKLNKEFKVTILICSSLLKEEYSDVFNEIKDKYNIICLHVDIDTCSSRDMALYSAELAVKTLDTINFNDFDLLILIADRFELLPVAMASAYSGCQICHIQAGEDSGNIDQKVRHAVTMLSDIAFVSHHVAEQRVKNMGIIGYNYGCPSIDVVKEAIKLPIMEKTPYLIAMFHPHTEEEDYTKEQYSMFVEAVSKFSKHNNVMVYWFAPNNDPGYKQILDSVNKEYIITNMDGRDFIRLLAHAEMIVGNSSAGIRESSYLGIPSVNIGNRQRGRVMAKNVVNCPAISVENIYVSMLKAYKSYCNQSTLFGSGFSSEKIILQLKEFLNDKI